MRGAALCLAPFLAALLACGRDTGPPRASLLEVECKSRQLPAGTQELAVFEGHVSPFLRRRLRVVDGELRWGAESLGSVQRGDKVEFSDAGWSVNGEHRAPIGIELELHLDGSTIKYRLAEAAGAGAAHDNRVGDFQWHFFDDTLHVGDRAYGPIRPGDSVRVSKEDVRVNGKPVEPLR